MRGLDRLRNGAMRADSDNQLHVLRMPRAATQRRASDDGEFGEKGSALAEFVTSAFRQIAWNSTGSRVSDRSASIYFSVDSASNDSASRRKR
jgi:hypothetical protein